MKLGELLAELSDEVSVSGYDDKNYKWFEIDGMKFWKHGESELVVQHYAGHGPDKWESVETTIDMDFDSVLQFLDNNK